MILLYFKKMDTDNNFLIQLTNSLYRMTLFFPKKEPLRYKIRETAADILAKPTLQNLELINTFFEVAKNQNWVAPIDILAIQSNYDNLRNDLIKAPLASSKEIEANNTLTSSSLLERQKKILELLKEKGRAQVWEAKQIFPKISKRTLRRDFEFLLKQGVIERFGEKNNTFYQIKLG